MPGEAVREPLQLPPREALSPQACSLLMQHGCQLTYHEEHTEVCVPEGTTRQEIGPRAYEQHFCLTFPDGWIAEEHRRRAPAGFFPMSLLWMPAEHHVQP